MLVFALVPSGRPSLRISSRSGLGTNTSIHFQFDVQLLRSHLLNSISRTALVHSTVREDGEKSKAENQTFQQRTRVLALAGDVCCKSAGETETLTGTGSQTSMKTSQRICAELNSRIQENMSAVFIQRKKTVKNSRFPFFSVWKCVIVS